MLGDKRAGRFELIGHDRVDVKAAHGFEPSPVNMSVMRATRSMVRRMPSGPLGLPIRFSIR